MKAALIRDGIVENIIIAGEGFDPGPDYLVAPVGTQPVGIGWAYFEDGTFVEPPSEPIEDPVPQSVTARQARLALFAFGLLQTLEDAIASLPGPEGAAARIEWEYASNVYRDSPMILGLAPALGMTPEQIDTLFRVAQDL